ncbi:MAG: sigma-54 interaction domain-containing protein, partial [Limisphaerales bacterium]
ESGTGKELVARALHYNSSRSRCPFVPLNCSALPENLLESELFGHRKGAFTGAIADKEGLFHEANGGTIFLDEIGTMPAQLQSRLLRVLQEKEVRRVGDNVSTQVNVRVLAATNENLEELIKSGRFREDLYYRLNVVSVQLPPLRERADDIPMLAVHFLRDKVHLESGQRFRISQRAMETLSAYPWPGNVRELANVIERATVLAEAPLIRCRDLPPAFQRHTPADDGREEQEAAEVAEPVGAEINDRARGGPDPEAAPRVEASPQAVRPLGNIISLKKFSRDQEVNYLRQVLHKTNDNKEEAARLLDISLATLYRKLADDGE